MTKFTKILTGVSLLALTAGNAHALDIVAGSNSGVNTSVINAPVALAEEADETTVGALTSTYGFALGTNSTSGFATNQDLLLTVVVTNGEFSADVTGNAVSSSTTSTAVVASSSIQFDNGVATGLQGSDTVTFLVSMSGTGDEISIDLPITYDGCDSGDLGVSATLTTDANLIIEEGTVSLATPAVTCANAYESTIASDQMNGDSQFTSATGFTQFDTAIVGPSTDQSAGGILSTVANDTTTQASLGTLEVEFNPDGFTGLILDDLSSLSNVVDGDEIASVAFDVTYATPAGITNSFLGGASGVPVGGVSSLVNAAVPNVGTNNYIDVIGVNVDGTTQISPQVPATSDHLVTFVTAGNLIADEPGVTSDLDNLDFQGATCGVFDWVGDERSATNTLWRVTGHGDQVSQVFATLTEINNQGFTGGMAATDTVDITSEVVGLGQPEILITNQQIAAVRPKFGRADVMFTFTGGLEASLDCDRLQSGGTFTPFGNDAKAIVDAVNAAVAGTDGDD